MKIKCKAYVDSKAQMVSPGYITLDGSRIASVLPFTETPDLNLDDVILMPGFVNAHCHLELTDFGPLPQKPFTAWVENLIQTQRQTQDFNVNTSIHKGLSQLLKSGVTTIIDHISPLTPIEHYDVKNINIIAIAEVLGTQLEIAQKNFEIQSEKIKANPHILISPHSVYGLHEDVFSKVIGQSHSVSLHISESSDEKMYFQNKSGPLFDFIEARHGEHNFKGQSPLQTLVHLGLKLENSLIVHGNDLSDQDLEILKSWPNNCIVHCPGSFAYFGHTHFPWQKILNHNIKTALGTDSLASNTTLNFLNEIRLFLKMFPQTTFEQLLPMITTNALEALQIHTKGKIAKGYDADFVGFIAKPHETILDILKTRQKADFVMFAGLIQV